jgi:hypothetical protein
MISSWHTVTTDALAAILETLATLIGIGEKLHWMKFVTVKLLNRLAKQHGVSS